MPSSFIIHSSSHYYNALAQVPLAERLSVQFTWDLVKDQLCNINYHDFEYLVYALTDCQLFKQYYSSIDPFSEMLSFATVISVIHYLLSVVTDNYSQVDKAWSLLPGLYTWHFCYHDYLNRHTIHPRLLLGAVLVTLWGFRLSWNLARKGGYAWEGQDYRFPYIKRQIGPVAMGLLNITFIAPAQNYLLVLLVTPLYLSSLTYEPFLETLTLLDGLAAVLFLTFLIIEMTADEQQYVFQTEKHCLIRHGAERQGDHQRGFLTSGLFKYSRHPNFFAEMGIWWSVYVFSISTSSAFLNWTIIGPIGLTLLFQSSTSLTEKISAEKYDDYKLYQQSVNRFIPWKSTWKADKED